MSTLPIVVYGNGDVFREYFNAIVTSFGTSDFDTLIKIALLLAGVTVLFSFIMQRDLMVMVKWFGLYYLVVFVLFTPKTTVEIIDRVNQGHPYSVDNVPLGLAVVASYTSAIGDALTQLTEMNFTMPDDLRYGKTGLVFASRLVTEASQFEITDPEFDQNLQSFIQQCVFYDVLLHKYIITDLINANKLWDFVSAKTSPARAFIYNREVTVCKTGAAFLNDDWKGALDHAANQYANRLFPNDSNTKKKIFRYLEKGYGYLTKLSENGSEIMKQHLMANAIQRGVIRMDGSVNAGAAMESYAYTRAQDQKRLTNKTLGDMAAYWLPLMKNAFEAIMYGSFIFIVLLSVFPFGWVVLKHYIFTLLWIQLWAPLYAIINLLVSYYSSIQSTAAVQGALTLKSMPGLLQINSDMAGLAGYLTLSVPFLSAGLAKGMAGTFTQLSQYVNGVTQSTGGAGAQEAVTGNMSLGNTNFQNHSAFNTNANHYDTSGRFSAGQFTGMLPGGSTVTAMPDGSLVMNTQGAISQLGTSVSLGQSIRSAASSQADLQSTLTENKAKTYSQSLAQNVRDVYELSRQTAHSESDTKGGSVSTNSSTGDALNAIRRETDKLAVDYHKSYDDAERAMTAAYIDSRVEGRVSGGINILGTGATASVSGGIGAKAERDHSNSKMDKELYAAARDRIQDSNYSRNMDTVMRAVKDHSFRANDDTGQRLLDSTAASLDRSESVRQDLTESYQKAESFREMASRSDEKMFSQNQNLSQELFEFMKKQSGTNGYGHLSDREIANIFTRHGELASHYVKDFSEHYVKSHNFDLNKKFPASHKTIEHAYDAKTASSNNTLQDHFEKSKSVIDREALKQNISLDRQISHDAELKAEAQIKKTEHDIKEGKREVDKRSARVADIVRKEGIEEIV